MAMATAYLGGFNGCFWQHLHKMFYSKTTFPPVKTRPKDKTDEEITNSGTSSASQMNVIILAKVHVEY